MVALIRTFDAELDGWFYTLARGSHRRSHHGLRMLVSGMFGTLTTQPYLILQGVLIALASGKEYINPIAFEEALNTSRFVF